MDGIVTLIRATSHTSQKGREHVIVRALDSHPKVVLVVHMIWGPFLHSPHMLVRATSERFLPAGGIFRAILASESQWLQPVLVFSVHWWPAPAGVGSVFINDPKAVTIKLWEPIRKCLKAILRHLQKHVVWSRILKCTSTKCYYNEFIFMRVLTHNKIE